MAMYKEQYKVPLQLLNSDISTTASLVTIIRDTPTLSWHYTTVDTPSSESMRWSEDWRWWSFCFTLDFVGESFTTLNIDCDSPVSSSTLCHASAALAFNSCKTNQTHTLRCQFYNNHHGSSAQNAYSFNSLTKSCENKNLHSVISFDDVK